MSRVRKEQEKNIMDQCSHWASHVVLLVKSMPANAGNSGNWNSIPESEGSSGAGSGDLFQYSCLENFMGRRVQSQTWLSASYAYIICQILKQLNIEHMHE